MHKNTILLIIIAALVLGMIIYALFENAALELSVYKLKSKNLPKGFDGLCIVQISDLHNAEFDKNNKKLIDVVKGANPDIIAITGDMVDSRHTDMDIALDFIKQAVPIAPCYYVSGNHESRLKDYAWFKQKLIEAGVIVVENERIELRAGEDSIALLGMEDPAFLRQSELGAQTDIPTILDELSNNDSGDEYKILLCHRPELFLLYEQAGVDLALCGHAHGGQIRLPFVGAIYAPNQGFLPKYTSGIYCEGNTNMVVSRGIGNSILPLRINNRPQVVAVELHCE